MLMVKNFVDMLVYSCGASFKDLGKKCFAINEFSDKTYISKLLEVLENE